jgi:hypothetical protein
MLRLGSTFLVVPMLPFFMVDLSAILDAETQRCLVLWSSGGGGDEEERGEQTKVG